MSDRTNPETFMTNDQSQFSASEETRHPDPLESQAIRPGWSRWYLEAREEMAFRYGIRGVPVDDYKTEWALGSTVHQAAAAIAKARGER